ncbi:nickel pincer cofactor biosynthesis protein LarB [Halobaculum sp. CBA1158]|uniref:nickel pincer cofactor biosynthesis protein LarB n=1 Tax=Halobaculum sp. CBA1158 TaxID=2904243 RepID=UPI001F2218E2|nr:nickel pincer cofactor biosynthesis protein LarB [Halobaculum sp. CBA1158]UIP00132.1 nickel pincer cofactor biosynthesis protein LarB [Halobaculum sp. CBA1158]
MRETLDALAAGELTPAEAEATLRGYATTEAGRFDAARERRRGIPEGILSEGKTPAEVAAMVDAALDTTGRALVTRADDDAVAGIRTVVEEEYPAATIDRDERARTVVVRAQGYEPPSVDADVVVVSGGTADAHAAREAAVVAGAAGPRVETVEDVGVANVSRVLDRADTLRAADVVVAVAGREAALPTVVAGLVDAPVIGVPTATGYGMGGDGEAALLGLLQSCTVLSVVNVDAGFVAGAQAALIARGIGDTADATEPDDRDSGR